MGRSNAEKIWLGGAAVVAVLIAVVGYFFLIGPQRSRTDAVRAQVADAQLQGSTLQARIVSLTAQQHKLGTYLTALGRARAALPDADDAAARSALLQSLQSIARRTSTTVSSYTSGDPTAVIPTVAATPTDTASASSSAPSSTTTDTAAPAPTLYTIAITASVNGSANGLAAFLTDLQLHQPRALLISSVTLGGSTESGAHGDTMTLTMTAFARPSQSAATASATPTATASTP